MSFLWFGKKKPDDKTMKSLNEIGAKIYDEAYEYYSNMAKEYNGSVYEIFNDWWHGKCVSTEEYTSKYSEEDRRKAGNVIMDAVSSGLG